MKYVTDGQVDLDLLITEVRMDAAKGLVLSSPKKDLALFGGSIPSRRANAIRTEPVWAAGILHQGDEC